ncbi:MAG: peptidylprolyl isomerase [Chloroflexi bacterium]|nr:peptidylprolyl isomerase [Chloroflexota bacterium]
MRDDRTRRSMLMNIGFGLTVAVALLLLAIAGGVAWYGDHLAPAAEVNGQTITKDAYGKQIDINAFRIDYQQRRIRTLLTAGQIRAADATARQSVLDQRLQQADTIALEQLIDGAVQADLATQQGVTIADADVDARLVEEATTPEMRHAWMIEVAPEIPTGESVASDATKAAAKATADKAVADLKAGKDWSEVAKAVSTDASSEQGGDLGFVDKNAVLDPAFSEAIQAAALDTPTGVIEGADGSYRIGLVTDIVAPVVDATLEQQVADAGISMDDFRAALRRDVTRTKLSDAILAQYLAPGPQRKVAEIYMQEGTSESEDGAIKTRHILYSPNDDAQNAANVAADDPAWTAAETAARATYEKLKADPSLFDSIARAESDEGAARTSGGKLPYFAPIDSIDAAFAEAIFKGGYAPGQLLEPVRSGFGWHVIQVMHYPTDAQWATQLTADIDAGTLPFADAARDNSDNAEAAQGGDIGWVGKGQLPKDVEQAVFAAPVGKVSDPLVITGDGMYLFLVSAEETRSPDAEQKASLESSAFPMWYSEQKAGYEITRNIDTTGSATG